MTTDLTPLVHHLRRLASPAAPDSDATLLRRFVRSRDESAFTALVARHGPMVLRVCRRVLGDPHAAEDAAQAVFLVLARRASSILFPSQLTGWLYGVALRVARKAYGARGRRRLPRATAGDPEPAAPTPEPLADLTARELLGGLDEEVHHLPEVYRLPVILCCLEGLSQEEAARRLGWTPGSVKGRLERGRARLHARLVRRGLTLGAALAAVEAARGTATAAVFVGTAGFAAGRVGIGVSAPVLALAENVAGSGAVPWKGLAPLALVLALAGAGLGMLPAWGTGRAALQAQPPAPPRGQRAEAPPEPEKTKEDPVTEEMKRLEGTWIPVAYQSGKDKVEGEEFKKSDLSQFVLTIKDGKYQEKYKDGTSPALTLRIDPTKTPKTLDRTGTEGETKGQVARSIYDLDGDRLRICTAFEFAEVRPKAFADPGAYVMVYKRAEEKRPGPPARDKLRDPAGHPVRLQGGVGAPAAFSPDGKRVIGGDAKNLCVWDAATGKLLTTDQLKVVGNLTLTPDGKLLSMSDGVIGPRFSPDGALLAGVPAGSGKVVLRDARTGEVVHTLAGVKGDGQGEVMLWDLSTGKALRSLEGSAGAPTTQVFSPDGKFVAGITREGEVKLWDAATGKVVRTLGNGQAHCVAFSPDGRRVAADGAELWVWDAADGKERLAVRATHDGGVNTVAFSPDGKLLITAGNGPHKRRPLELIPVTYDGEVKVWDAETGKELLAFGTNQMGNLDWACVAPDGEHVLTNGGWDKKTMALWSLYGDK